LINQYQYSYTVIETPKGGSGPPPEPIPFTCNALPRKDNKNRKNGHFAFEVALINGDVKLLDWLYNQNLSPYNNVDIWSYPEESIRWLKLINERDQLGIEIVNQGPYG
jgi:hypothetical protein